MMIFHHIIHTLMIVLKSSAHEKSILGDFFTRTEQQALAEAARS